MPAPCHPWCDEIMTDVPDTRTAAVRLASAALVLAVVALVVLLFVPAENVPLRVVVLAVSGVVSPLLTVVALLLLITPALGLGRRYEASVVTATAVAFTADLFFVLALSASVDESDAGVARSVFGSLTWAFGLVSAAGFATLATLLLFVLLRRDDGTRPVAAAVISAVLALVITPFLVWSLAAPLITVFPALAVLIIAVVRPARGRPSPQLELRPSPSGRPGRLLTAQVRVLAAASLAYTAVVWVGAVAASIAATGTDAATSSLGTASGAGQLAVLPLMLAGALVAQARAITTRAVRVGTLAATAVVAIAATVMVVGYTPDGDIFMRNLALLALAVGAWCASIVWALTLRLPTASRVGLGVAALLGGSVVYLFGAAMTAGIPVALVSGFLVFGGARRLLRATPATSPATLPASA
jgi:hypothetical protein